MIDNISGSSWLRGEYATVDIPRATWDATDIPLANRSTPDPLTNCKRYIKRFGVHPVHGGKLEVKDLVPLWGRLVGCSHSEWEELEL